MTVSANILFLGVEGSGKTTLAMALVRAFARERGAGWYLRPVDRGAYTFATIAPEDFTRDGFPRQTANVREMAWRIERDGVDLGALEILDYPGEVYRLAFLNADDEPDPAAFRERAAAHAAEIARLRAALDAAARVFVLFNLQDALDLRNNDANRGAVWVTNESLKAVKALPSHPQLTLVFTQVDRYQTADDFLHAFTPRELDLIGHDHPDVDWAMVSVLMEPASEFGINAFVRRCTGFADFGVPNGRPEAAVPGGALRRLEAATHTTAPTEPPAPETPAKTEPSKPAVPPAAETPKALRALLLIVFALACGVAVFVHLRAAAARAVNDVTRGAATNAVAVTVALAPTNAPAATPTNAPTVASQRLAKRLGTAAWSAWVKAEAARVHTMEAAARKLAQARAAASPQAAHEPLCEAAEAGNAEAQEELARVYDIWGWGGWVRTAEERGAPWRDWLRRIDVAPGAKAVCVSRPAPNADEFRKLARDWYRAAAANGRATAADALTRHEKAEVAP